MSRKNCCCVPMECGMPGSQLCCMPTNGYQMYQVSPVQVMPSNMYPGYPGYQGNNNNSWIWILILLCCCGNNNGGFDPCNGGCNNGCHGGCGSNNWLWIIILLCCCCGNNGFGGFGCGC